MAFQFPWTNFHELNLDWFLSKFKQFTDNYLGTTATAESVPYTDAPSVTVTGGELDDDTDIVDPFTFNFKIPAGQPGEQGEQGEQGVPGQDGFSPIATVTKSGTVATITITDVNGTTTTTISDGEVTQAQLDTKAPAIFPTVSGSIANFSDGADNLPMSELTVGITAFQSGSGDPAPDNIRPISGWTGANAKRAGKNLLEKSFEYYTNVSTDLSNYFFIKEGTYNFNFASSTASHWRFLARLKDLNGNVLSDSDHNPSTNFSYRSTLYGYSNGSNTTATDIKLTIVEDCYIRLLYWQTSSSDTFTNCQLEIGERATGYQPYITPATITVDWTSVAGTVYGGALDVSTGVLTVTDGYIASYNGETLPSTWISDRDVYAPGTTPTTGAQVVYKLATPLTYQLTPQQLFNTLYGVNNVWSDTGDSTVTYTADTMLYIQNLTQPTEDDMIANTAIANGKFFMIGNNLYRATTAIASGSQIIPGTNATPLSLADALNLL